MTVLYNPAVDTVDLIWTQHTLCERRGIYSWNVSLKKQTKKDLSLCWVHWHTMFCVSFNQCKTNYIRSTENEKACFHTLNLFGLHWMILIQVCFRLRDGYNFASIITDSKIPSICDCLRESKVSAEPYVWVYYYIQYTSKGDKKNQLYHFADELHNDKQHVQTKAFPLKGFFGSSLFKETLEVK